MDATFTTPLSLIAIVILAWIGVKFKHFLSLRQQGNTLPGSEPDFLWGNLLELQKMGGFSTYLPKLHQEYGKLARFWLGRSTLVVSVNDPELLSEIAGKLQSLPETIKPIFKWVGDEIFFFRPSQEAKSIKMKLSRLLSGQTLDCLCASTQYHMTQLLERWESIPNESSLNLRDELSQVSLAIMGDCLIGEEFSRSSLGQAISTSFIKVLEGVQPRSEELIPAIWTRSYWDWQKTVATLHQSIYTLIDQRQKDPNLNNRSDFLSQMICAKNDRGKPIFSKSDIRATLVSFLFGGFDPIAVALTQACQQLAQHPELQAQVREHLDRSLNHQPPQLEDLGLLNDVKQILQETMRISPASSVTMRQVESDIELAGYSIPKGTIIFIPICALHQNQEIWAKPEQFLPERFSSDGEHKRSRYAYIPFGIGARGCIGGHFAMTQLLVMLPMLLQKFSIEQRGKLLVEPTVSHAPISWTEKLKLLMVSFRESTLLSKCFGIRLPMANLKATIAHSSESTPVNSLEENAILQFIPRIADEEKNKSSDSRLTSLDR